MSTLKDELLRTINTEVESDPEDDDSFDIFEESVEKIVNDYGSDAVLISLLEILNDESNKKYWYLAASIVSWLVDDDVELPFEWTYLVASLYVCLERLPDLGMSGSADGTNLVWSIAHAVKKVGYLDDWNPLEDSEILACMKSIKGG